MSAGAEGGHLLRNMVLFARLLRAAGLEVSPRELRDWLEAALSIDVRRREDFLAAAESVLVRRREDLELFRRAFDLFWRARDPRQLADLDLGLMVRKSTRRTERRRQQGAVALDEAGDGEGQSDGDSEPEEHTIRTYSDSEVLRHKDFAELDSVELAEVRELLLSMSWRFDERRTRRRVWARHGRYLDPRRSFRRSLATGGELIQWARLDRKLKRRPLTLLCDISGSMEPYSRILLQFLYAATNGMERVEAFVFGTRLTRITHHLRDSDVDEALESVHREVLDFGGGTRIGEALRSFNFSWSRRVLGGGASVLIISDGWDRGDAELLRREMDRLQRSAHRLIWLNPLLGSPRYEPLTRGIQAALPYIHDFMPVHNLHSLEQLGRHLRKLYRGERPALRRGRVAAVV